MAYTTTTGQDVLDAMLEQPDDDNQIPWLNRAIRASWPAMKIAEYEAGAVTILENTFTYTVTTTPSLDRKLGLGRVFVQAVSSEPPLEIHAARQYWDDAAVAWKLVLPGDMAWGGYVGALVDVMYQHQHVDIEDLDDTITLPHDFLVNYMDWMQQSKKLSVQTTDARSIPQLVNQYWEAWHDDMDKYHAKQISMPMLPGYERLQTA